MHLHALHRWTATAIVFLFPGVLQGPQPDYAIKLHRPSVVGQKYLLVASVTEDQSMTTSIDGQTGPADTSSGTAEITARVTTLAVTAAGKESKVSFVIEKSKLRS